MPVALTSFVGRREELSAVGRLLGERRLVARLVAAELDVMVEPEGDPLQVLASMLRSRNLRLCLDTCEHLLDAVAELTRTLLRVDGLPLAIELARTARPLHGHPAGRPMRGAFRVIGHLADLPGRILRQAVAHQKLRKDEVHRWTVVAEPRRGRIP